MIIKDIYSCTRQSFEELLAEIEKFASLAPINGAPRLKAAIQECEASYPDKISEIQAHIQRGQQSRELLLPFHELGKRYDLNSSEAQKALNDLKQQRPDIVYQAREILKRGEQAAKRSQETQQLRNTGQPLSQVKPRPHTSNFVKSPEIKPVTRSVPSNPVLRPEDFKLEKSIPATPYGLHPQDIRGLQPCSHWRVLIDETGVMFDESANQLKQNDWMLGRIVGLLMPWQRSGLQPLRSGWHAVNKSIHEIDRVIQAILDAPVGVIGITVKQLPLSPTERWSFGVLLRLIELVLRLLPLDGPTRITVLVEQRAEFSKDTEWPAVAGHLLLRLAEIYPERARQIRSCQIQVIGKDGSPYNGYADALAYIWGSPAPHSRDCLKHTGFEGTCYLPGDAAAISRAWEWLDRGITLEGSDWAMLLTQPEATQAGSLTGAILERLGQASQNDTVLWQRYLDHTLNHLDSKAIDLRVLGRQVEWLETWTPPGQILPPPARLLWLTAKLARANHLGHTEQPWLNELQTLGDQLLEENAHLVCRAELNLAVNATNCYDFDLASRILDRWQNLPKAVPGLRYWAQVQSSFGQHAAFRGNLTLAVTLFDQALAAFARLSNVEEGRREARQTQTYRAIALMDDPHRADAEVRAAVESVTGPLPDAVSRLAVSEAEGDKYAHHLLLRWLVTRPDAVLHSSYLNPREQWTTNEGHPWPLIQLYRGLLLRNSDPDAARELALDGFRRATTAEQGPVVQLIGACCRAIAVHWGSPWPDAETTLAPIENALPMAKGQVAIVRRFFTDPNSPLEFLQAVLPFNFH